MTPARPSCHGMVVRITFILDVCATEIGNRHMLHSADAAPAGALTGAA